MYVYRVPASYSQCDCYLLELNILQPTQEGRPLGLLNIFFAFLFCDNVYCKNVMQIKNHQRLEKPKPCFNMPLADFRSCEAIKIQC